SEITSRIIMQDVLVLAVDQAASKPEDKNSLVPQTVVVEVTPKQAEALSLATDIGSIRLILRGFGDDEKVSTLGVNPKGIQSNGEGKSDDSEDLSPAKETPSRLAGKIPDVPDGASAPEVKAPAGRVHVLRILVGDTATSHQYVLNAKNEVILPENAPANDEEATPEATTAPKNSEGAKSDAPKVKKGYKPAAAPPAAKTAPQGPSASYQDAPLPGISSPKN
ncbi:MAG TPA: RcpC/CpaB family pilus assembly protein, partial [Gemmataceae bacterium]|nr:RcpC/CpaB family pilus assembly protein [Gemmataceae bacterium]